MAKEFIGPGELFTLLGGLHLLALLNDHLTLQYQAFGLDFSLDVNAAVN